MITSVSLTSDGKYRIYQPLRGERLEAVFKQRLYFSAMFGPDIGLDFRYNSSNMSSKVCLALLRSIEEILRVNRLLTSPYRINFFNLSNKSELYLLIEEKGLLNNLAVVYHQNISITDKFISQELLCVSPYSKNVMKQTDLSHCIPVIPAVLSSMQCGDDYPEILAKENVKSAQLPLDRYVM